MAYIGLLLVLTGNETAVTTESHDVKKSVCFLPTRGSHVRASLDHCESCTPIWGCTTTIYMLLTVDKECQIDF